MSITDFAFDLETDLIQPGLLAPPIVCGSVAEITEPGKVKGHLMTRDQVMAWYRENVGKVIITGANIAYDNGVMAVEDGSFELLCKIFDAYERGMFSDVQLREMLNHIGHGWVEKDYLVDPRTGGVLMDPARGKKAERMSLATVLYLTLGRTDAKKNADWRLRYARLRNVPMAQWPEEARVYPVDDVVNTGEAKLVQAGRGEGQHTWENDRCTTCGIEVSFSTMPPCTSPGTAHMNLHNEGRQLRAAWALQLASMWGLRTDPVAVAAIEQRVDAAMATAMVKFKEYGFRRADDSEDGSVLARRVARAYGDTDACTVCAGTGKTPSEKTGNPINCKACSGSGIALIKSPLTDKGNIKSDRDTLLESGDEILERYAYVSQDEKFQKTYLPYLRQATMVPLTPQGNVLLNTGRTSYDGLIQLIPRGGGLRECFVPRDGSVYCSIDYSALELSTLAQVLIWVVGWSNMADATNDGLDLHTKFAASMTGNTYDGLKALVKSGDKAAAGYRQAAKAANFGFPGGMGPAKLVVSKRREGLRFCVALGQAPQCGCSDPKLCRRCHGRGVICGTEMLREWNGRECPPVCRRCVEIADQLKTAWMREWPEVKHYFKYITNATRAAGQLEQFVSRRIRGGLDFCNGANTLFQGLAADGAKHALWLVSKECYTDQTSPMFGARPVIFVHDEIFSEIPEAIAPEAADRMTKVMVNGMSEFVPDVRVSAEPTLMRRWYKEAKCVRDAAGRLMVWEPPKEAV